MKILEYNVMTTGPPFYCQNGTGKSIFQTNHSTLSRCRPFVISASNTLCLHKVTIKLMLILFSVFYFRSTSSIWLTVRACGPAVAATELPCGATAGLGDDQSLRSLLNDCSRATVSSQFGTTSLGTSFTRTSTIML